MPICLFSHEKTAFEEWRTDPALDERMESTRSRVSKSDENKKQPSIEKSCPADNDGTCDEMPRLPTSPLITLPDVETTVGAKLQKCKEMLKLESGEITFGGEHSKTTARVLQIMQFLRAVVKSEGGHGGRRGEPAALHVCGVPGSGKTMAVDWCCNKALELAKDSAEEWDKAPTFYRINGSHYENLTTKLDFLKDLKTVLSANKGQTFSESDRRGSKIAKKSTVVLVMDEIDLLVSDKSENFLSSLLGWASNEQMTFGIIGISNFIENSKARRLYNIGGVSVPISCLVYNGLSSD